MFLATVLRTLRDDVRAIMRNDPAACNLAEVLLYPGLHAILLHRLAHPLYRANIPFLPRLVSQLSRFLTGIEIHPGARIGCGFFIDHGMGVVVGETAEIGDWVMLYQGVTLGGTGKQKGKRHPTVHDYAVIGVGASVLGAITVGQGARVGGGAVVVRDVPPFATAVGVPARIVATRDPVTGESRRVEYLPDPEGVMLRNLHDKMRELESRLLEVEVICNHPHQEPGADALPDSLWAILEDVEDVRLNNGDGFEQGAGI